MARTERFVCEEYGGVISDKEAGRTLIDIQSKVDALNSLDSALKDRREREQDALRELHEAKEEIARLEQVVEEQHILIESYRRRDWMPR